MAPPPPLSFKGDQLYVKCLEKSTASKAPNSDIFHQADLIAMNVAEGLADLVALCQELSNANLFQILTIDRDTCYRCRARDAAAKMSALGDKEYILYSTIEATGTTGIWSKTLTAKTNLHQTVMAKALKTLEGKGYVKQIKSVKYPKRKIYMLKELNPTEEVTGGPWFSDGEMDVGFIEKIGELVENYVKEMSWRDGPRLKSSTALKPPLKNMDEPNTSTEINIQSDPRFYGAATSRRGRPLLPHPPGYNGYPTTSDILTWIDSVGIIQDKDVTLPDMQNLLDVLVYDGKIERIGRKTIVADTVPGTSSVRNFDVMDVDDASPQPSSGEENVVPKKRAIKLNGKEKDSRAALTPQPAEPEFEDMFRWVRRPEAEDFVLGPGNGFSETPCSRCPVFRLCEEGGPVDARSCAYFEPWLAA